jgi:hypothetical protein
MERFAVIIPDRNDRPELTNYCLQQIARMTRKPDQIIHVKYNAIDDSMDLCERVHNGVMIAKEMNFDLVFIIENDDYYPADYFERFGDFNADFFGDDLTFYYNLRNRTFQSFPHQGRASLFTTGFRISALGSFQFKGDQFLDLKIWRHAIDSSKRLRFVHTGAIGMKHGMGLCGGKGHKMKLRNHDHNMAWLKGRVDSDSFLFYADLSRKLWMIKETV